MLLTIACVLVILYITLRTWPLVPILAGIAVAGYIAFWVLVFAYAAIASPGADRTPPVAEQPTRAEPNVYAPFPRSDSPHVQVYAPPISGPDAPGYVPPDSSGRWPWIVLGLLATGIAGGLYLLSREPKDPLMAALDKADKEGRLP